MFVVTLLLFLAGVAPSLAIAAEDVPYPHVFPPGVAPKENNTCMKLNPEILSSQCYSPLGCQKFGALCAPYCPSYKTESHCLSMERGGGWCTFGRPSSGVPKAPRQLKADERCYYNCSAMTEELCSHGFNTMGPDLCYLQRDIKALLPVTSTTRSAYSHCMPSCSTLHYEQCSLGAEGPYPYCEWRTNSTALNPLLQQCSPRCLDIVGEDECRHLSCSVLKSQHDSGEFLRCLPHCKAPLIYCGTMSHCTPITTPMATSDICRVKCSTMDHEAPCTAVPHCRYVAAGGDHSAGQCVQRCSTIYARVAPGHNGTATCLATPGCTISRGLCVPVCPAVDGSCPVGGGCVRRVNGSCTQDCNSVHLLSGDTCNDFGCAVSMSLTQGCDNHCWSLPSESCALGQPHCQLDGGVCIANCASFDSQLHRCLDEQCSYTPSGRCLPPCTTFNEKSCPSNCTLIVVSGGSKTCGEPCNKTENCRALNHCEYNNKECVQRCDTRPVANCSADYCMKGGVNGTCVANCQLLDDVSTAVGCGRHAPTCFRARDGTCLSSCKLFEYPSCPDYCTSDLGCVPDKSLPVNWHVVIPMTIGGFLCFVGCICYGRKHLQRFNEDLEINDDDQNMLDLAIQEIQQPPTMASRAIENFERQQKAMRVINRHKPIPEPPGRSTYGGS